MIIQKSKLIVLIFSFLFCIFNFKLTCYALNIDKVKVAFLNGDYKAAITEGERVLAVEGYSKDIDQLYYILGLSYFKDGNHLRASDIFEIVIKEFNNSSFKDKARLGLGDIDFVKGNFDKAQNVYEELLNSAGSSELRPQLYYRLSEVALKKDNPGRAKEYLAKLKSEFPNNIETRLNKDLSVIADSPSGLYYTVQVGCFSSGINAGNLTKKLAQQGYSAYVEEAGSDSGRMYRVRVGKVQSRQEASLLENKLSAEGYPTKIYP